MSIEAFLIIQLLKTRIILKQASIRVVIKRVVRGQNNVVRLSCYDDVRCKDASIGIRLGFFAF